MNWSLVHLLFLRQFDLDVAIWALGFSTTLIKHFLHVRAIFCGELGPLHGNLFENHLVLSQCASLVSQQELESTQFFWNCRVSSNAAWDSIITFDAEGVVDLREIQVDFHRNWDDRAEKKDHPEEFEVPIPFEAIDDNNSTGKRYHADEENFRQPVDLHIEFANLLPRWGRVHCHASFLSTVDNHTKDVSWRGQDSVCPNRILK